MAESSPLAHSPTLVVPSGEAKAGTDRLPQGAAVGEYVIERFLGAGAMGEVYGGAQPVIGKKVAIKVLKPEVAATKDGTERFKREARAANAIDHPNVIDIFSFGRLEDGRLYLVMDLVSGRSLRRVIAEGPMEVGAALDVLEQIASALDAAHARGVVHRDLKPDNVMLGDGGKAWVLDFGLAKLLQQGDSAPPASMLTGQGVWLGTPGYMAPEQWSADGAGPASDRYSLGVIAFELLSGSLPFSAPSLPAMMEQHFRAKVPALSSKGAVATSSVFDPIIARALAKDPTARFPSGKAMVEALRERAGVTVKGKGRSGFAVDTAGKRPAWVPAAAGLGVLGLGVAAILLVRGDHKRSDESGQDPDPAAASATQPPARGMVRVQIASVPADASVYRAGHLIGTTPTAVDVPAGTLAFEVRKPGYATAKESLTITEDTALPAFTLAPINGFEGVWQLPTKELRAFKRAGDRIEVSKLDAVDGPREFFRHYELMPSEGGIAFGMSEELVDSRAPSDPACHVPHKVEYQYDPQTDQLVLRRERVAVDFKGGHCVVVSSELGAPESLVRVDRGAIEPRESLPPAGKPTFDKQAIDKQAIDTNPPVDDNGLGNAFDSGGAKDNIKTVKPSKKAPPPPIKASSVPQVQTKKSISKASPKSLSPPANAAANASIDAQDENVRAADAARANTAKAGAQEQQQIAPQAQNVQNPPAKPYAPPQAPPRAQAPQQPVTKSKAAEPQGDSQVAPQQGRLRTRGRRSEVNTPVLTDHGMAILGGSGYDR